MKELTSYIGTQPQGEGSFEQIAPKCKFCIYKFNKKYITVPEKGEKKSWKTEMLHFWGQLVGVMKFFLREGGSINS